MVKVFETEALQFFKLEEMDLLKDSCSIPLFYSGASCGFPNPADDYIQERIDISEYLVPNPLSTFFVRAKGNSMEGSRIFDSSLLIVDRSITPASGSICLCILEREFTVKKLERRGGEIYLVATNRQYQVIKVTTEMDFEVWGVITNVVSKPE